MIKNGLDNLLKDVMITHYRVMAHFEKMLFMLADKIQGKKKAKKEGQNNGN
jgi:hypothetical protein